MENFLDTLSDAFEGGENMKNDLAKFKQSQTIQTVGIIIIALGSLKMMFTK